MCRKPLTPSFCSPSSDTLPPSPSLSLPFPFPTSPTPPSQTQATPPPPFLPLLSSSPTGFNYPPNRVPSLTRIINTSKKTTKLKPKFTGVRQHVTNYLYNCCVYVQYQSHTQKQTTAAIDVQALGGRKHQQL